MLCNTGVGRFRILGGGGEGGGARFRYWGGGGGARGGGQIPSRHSRIEWRGIVLTVPSNQIKVTFIIILPFNLVYL